MDDFGNTPATAGTLPPGELTSGDIENSEDVDWFAVELVAGQTHVFQITEDGSNNTGGLVWISLVDENGMTLATDYWPDGGQGRRLMYTADSDGTFYINVYAGILHAPYILSDVTKGVQTGTEGDDVYEGRGVFALNSAEGAVYRLYQATLDRDPDTAGLNNWVQQLEDGTPFLEIVNGFIESAEFQSVYGALNDSDFVSLLYNNVLDREPDEQGFQSWLDQLSDGASRAEVVRGFSQSDEFKNGSRLESLSWATHEQFGDIEGFVFRLYLGTLGREPDEQGYQNWISRIEEGASLADIIPGFLDSDEFEEKYAGLNDVNFIDQLYQNVLGRPVDFAGGTTWLEQLENGATRADVVLGILNSDEFISQSRFALTDYLTFLQPDWVDTFFASSGSDEFLGGRGADIFVFDATDTGSHIVHGVETVDSVEFRGFGFSGIDEMVLLLEQVGEDVRFSDQGVEVLFTDSNIADVSIALSGLAVNLSPDLDGLG